MGFCADFLTTVKELVNRFQHDFQEYQSKDYDEAKLRLQFLDPFFTALGWDVNNRQGRPPHACDVVVESRTEIAGRRKRADYAFRIAGMDKWVCEAKKPAEELDRHAFQIQNYTYNLRLYLGVLSDFENLNVYVVGAKPDRHRPFDPILTFHYADYPKRAQELWDLLARESVASGSIDRFIGALPKTPSRKAKQGWLIRPERNRNVDDDFLEFLDGVRLHLAKSFVKSNPRFKWGETALNEAVQKLIDRILFVRICEDRDIDTGRPLSRIVGEWRSGGGRKGQLYDALIGLFRQLAPQFNGGLFGRSGEPPHFSEELKIEDDRLAELIDELSAEDSTYLFSTLPVEILGSVYERFLGKVVHVSSGGTVTAPEKPEVRKAGGVYYTPRYIVNYIVEQTVASLIKDKSPKEVSALTILDPACGSGSFLIRAFERICEHHVEWYLAHPESQRPNVCYRDANKVLHLTTGQKRNILVNNIYGVDLDPQAVEVTQLSLYLKILEGETRNTLNAQRELFAGETILPDLSRNIVCGNSLIGTDILDGQLFSREDEEKLRPMNFEDRFPKIMKRGGFDAVVGNPPYVRMEGFKDQKDYLRQKYEVHAERADFYSYFIEREHKILRPGGRFGMIVSNKFLRANYGKPIRQFLCKNARIQRVVDYAGVPVFKGATVRTIVLLTAKDKHPQTHAVLYTPPPTAERFSQIETGTLTVDEAARSAEYEVPLALLADDVWSFPRKDIERLISKLKRERERLANAYAGLVCRGIVSGLSEAFVIDAETREQIVRKNPAAREIIKPFLGGREVRRYFIESNGNYLIYTYHGVPIEKYPAVMKHLEPFQAKLCKRATVQAWYELQQPQLNFAPLMDKPKLIFPDIATEPRFCLDESGAYGSNTTYFIAKPDLPLLAVLNSSVGRFYFKQVCAGLEGPGETYLRFFGQYLNGFPVPEFGTRATRLEALVSQMLEAKKVCAEAKSDTERDHWESKCDGLDRQIDALVYELYGLTEEEIRIVEGGSSG